MNPILHEIFNQDKPEAQEPGVVDVIPGKVVQASLGSKSPCPIFSAGYVCFFFVFFFCRLLNSSINNVPRLELITFRE